MKIVGERLAAQDPDKRPEIIWFNTWQCAQLGAGTQTAGALLWEICRKVAQVESAQTVQAREKRRRFITQAQQFLVAASVGAAKGATRLAGYGAVVDLVENGKDLWDGLEQTDGGLENPTADVTLLAELRESFARSRSTSRPARTTPSPTSSGSRGSRTRRTARCGSISRSPPSAATPAPSSACSTPCSCSP